MKDRNGNQGGYTLIELAVSLGLVLMVAASIYQVRTTALLTRQDLATRQKAVWALQSQAALIEATSFTKLDETRLAAFSPEAGPLDWPGARTSMTIEGIAPDLKKIALEVTWKDRAGLEQNLPLTIYRAGP